MLSIDPSSLSGVRRAFAAAPNESVLRPTIVSTIFPQLPRPSMAMFRTCLALGLATVLVLGLAKLYPVALIAGAVLLPVLVVLYMVDVNVFEEQSLPVIGGTLLWGLVAGAADGADRREPLAVGQRRVRRRPRQPRADPRRADSACSASSLILAGPLTMLRYPRYSTVLDGATFAAASASAFVAAEVIVQALSALGHGLRPPGSVVPWLVQLAIDRGRAAARHDGGDGRVRGRGVAEAPSADQGPLARSAASDRSYLALPLGAAMLVVSAVVQITLPSGVALAIIAVLAVLALLWLRQVIHVGLLEEALLIEDAPIITCANCGDRTRRGDVL